MPRFRAAVFRHDACLWLGLRFGGRRPVTSCRQQSTYALAFDIDGVLIRGSSLVPGAKDSLIKLRQRGVPFIFVTNGGGCTEQAKADELSSRFGLPVTKDMVLLSHSPMRELAKQYQDKRVMVLGSHGREIAEADLGLTNTVTVQEYACEWPDIFHFTGPKYYMPREYPLKKTEWYHDPISAVMVVHDPLDWALEVQVVVDVLRGGRPPGSGTGPQTPMYISNPDFVFAGRYSVPRFAAGAFADVVAMFYQRLTGQKCLIEQYGKPHGVTFSYAGKMLDSLCKEQKLTRPERIYMVGDNPSGDIRGANNAGSRWISNLVRTGVFQGKDNDPQDPAHNVFADVNACLAWVTEHESKMAG